MHDKWRALVHTKGLLMHAVELDVSHGKSPVPLGTSSPNLTSEDTGPWHQTYCEHLRVLTANAGAALGLHNSEGILAVLWMMPIVPTGQRSMAMQKKSPVAL